MTSERTITTTTTTTIIIIKIIIVTMIKFKSTAVFSKNVIKQLVHASAVCMSRYKAMEKFEEHS